MEPSRYEQLARGGGSWPARAADMPAFNAERLRTLPSRDPAALAAKLLADTDSLAATVTAFGDRQPMMNFDGNRRLRADTALGTLLAEFVIHGHDLARSVGADWPIDPALVPVILDGLHEVMPGWVDEDAAANHTASYELRLRGIAQSCVYAFDNGRLTVDPSPVPRIDVHISADPITWLLLSYGRANRWDCAMRGRILVWGRKPWLALRFAGRFHPP